MRKALSVKAIEALKPKVKRYEVHDILCPGFDPRVFPTGRKACTFKYRYGLTKHCFPIGVHPRISLADVRKKAIEALRSVDEGIDPGARRRQLGMGLPARSLLSDASRWSAAEERTIVHLTVWPPLPLDPGCSGSVSLRRKFNRCSHPSTLPAWSAQPLPTRCAYNSLR